MNKIIILDENQMLNKIMLQYPNIKSKILKEHLRDSKYKTELCKNFEETGICKYKNKCRYAHGKQELICKGLINKNYKKIKCDKFHGLEGYCQYGDKCQYLHDSRSIDNFCNNSYNNKLEEKTKEFVVIISKISENIKDINLSKNNAKASKASCKLNDNLSIKSNNSLSTNNTEEVIKAKNIYNYKTIVNEEGKCNAIEFGLDDNSSNTNNKNRLSIFKHIECSNTQNTRKNLSNINQNNYKVNGSNLFSSTNNNYNNKYFNVCSNNNAYQSLPLSYYMYNNRDYNNINNTYNYYSNSNKKNFYLNVNNQINENEFCLNSIKV